MSNQQSAQLICPLCQGRVPFADYHELTLHLASDAPNHLDFRPYPCQVCRSRFVNVKSLREHHQRAHPGAREQPLVYDPPSEEEQKKLRMLVVCAIGLQAGVLQAPREGPTVVTESLDGSINNLPPMVEPQRVLNRQPTPTALELNTVPEPRTAVPPKAQPVEGESVVCAECDEQIPASFLKQSQHVLHNHMDCTTATEANFTAMLQRCFPEAREFDNMTCTDCERKLTGKKASQEQLEHAEAYHLSELGVHLRCPVIDCPDADVIQSTRIALLRHVKQYHGGVGRLDRESKRAYNKMRKDAEQMLERMKRRFFPFTPPDVGVNRRRQRLNDDGGEVEDGEPTQRRVPFDTGDEHEMAGRLTPRDATQPRGDNDDGAMGDSVEGNERTREDGQAADDHNPARDDDDEEENEDYGTAFFSMHH